MPTPRKIRTSFGKPLLAATLVFTCLSLPRALAQAEDAALQSVLQEQLARMSPEGRTDFLRGHEEWKSFMQEYCAADNLHFHYDTPEACRDKLVQERAYRLETAIVTTPDGLVLRPTEHFAAHVMDIRDDPDGDRTKWPAEINISWPQIDNPSTEAHRQWNAAMLSQMPQEEETEGHYCDHSVRYSIPYTTPDFISTEVSEWWYCHSAAHGFGGTRSINRVLSANRTLVADDLFKVGSGWQAALVKMTRESVIQQEKKHADSLDIKEGHVSSPETWGFTREGLQVRLGWKMGYVNGEYTALIPWATLHPFIKKDSGFIPE